MSYVGRGLVALGVLACLVHAVLAGDSPVRPDRPNALTFPAQEAKFVRFVIFASNNASEPCIDELEVYGSDGERNLALARAGGRATASSCLPGYAIHQIAHLNDGRYGNAHSWIAAGTGKEWAQIELPQAVKISRVVFSRDRNGGFRDRVPAQFEIRLSTDGKTWKTVKKVSAPVAVPHGPARAPKLPAPPPSSEAGRRESDNGVGLRAAFLGEEHAWLKTYGRADLSPRLVPYNGRVKEYPHHVGDDRLPLPPLSSEPKLDGNFDDACWEQASRGVVRVAFPYDFASGPLAEHELTAGWRGDTLFLALHTDRWLSRHVAVISSADWQGCGVVVHTNDGLVFNTYDRGGKLAQSTPIEGRFDPTRTRVEMRLPLAWFPDCKKNGLRVGLGMGGKHTPNSGRPIHLVFSSLAVAQQGSCVAGTFRVQLAVPSGAHAVTVRGNAPEIKDGLTLAPGASRTIAIPNTHGPIGPEYELTLREGDGEPYALHLFRYDPLERAVHLMGELLNRLAAKGLDVRAERDQWTKLRTQHEGLMSSPAADRGAERDAFFRARVAKRRLFLREPDLAPLGKLLFAKRRPFEPSHNYSVDLDAPFRPGGGICTLDIPRRDGCLEPGEAKVTTLFQAEGGIARTPAADFDLQNLYFAYRPSAEGYYDIYRMNLDGRGLKRMTEGSFHDYWPCPLPDGGIAFISTRCKMRFICWRPQAAILFRMDPDGSNKRPLSYANLTEWAPSVMNDGRVIWTRSEYQDKGADFGHTLWAIRPDGDKPELVFGNTIIQPNGYANGREVPGTNEICCTLISHFGDLNGPVAFVDINQGRMNPRAIKSLTPEVPWPGMWPKEECFRDPVPVARDYVLCSHAPRNRFQLYVIDRFGNREVLYADPDISSMCPTVLAVRKRPPVVADRAAPETDRAEVVLMDVYEGIAPTVERGRVKYIRVVEEVRAKLERLANGEYRKDHPDFMKWYASPVDRVSGPYGWPTYVAKAPMGIVPVEEDGSAHFYVPAGKTLYFQALDADFNELQRMRSVVQFQAGEKRSCIGCHEGRQMAPPARRPLLAAAEGPRRLDPPPWGAGPFSFEKVVQPVLDAQCVQCHDANDKQRVDLTGTLDAERIPASYRTLISQGWVHVVDCGWNSGGCEKLAPLTFGTVKSKLWQVLGAGHHGVRLTPDERRRIKTWTDLNCPLWPDYTFRPKRPAIAKQLTRAE